MPMIVKTQKVYFQIEIFPHLSTRDVGVHPTFGADALAVAEIRIRTLQNMQ